MDTSKIARTTVADPSLTTEEVVPTQQRSHGSFSLSHVLWRSRPSATVNLPSTIYEAQIIATIAESTLGVYTSFSSVVTSGRHTPMSHGQNAAHSATSALYAFEPPSIAPLDTSSILLISPTRTHAESFTWSLGPLLTTIYTPSRETPSTSIPLVYGPHVVPNTTNLSRASLVATMQPLSTSQYSQTRSLSRALQSDTAPSLTFPKSSMVLSQAGASGVFQGWNSTTSRTGMAVTTRVASSTGSPTGRFVGVNSTSSHTVLPTSLRNSSTPTIPKLQTTKNSAIEVTSEIVSPLVASSLTPSQDLGRIITTYTTTLTTTQPVTGNQTGSPASPPPLTISQTAGVAIAGTTGLLIAVIAVLYIARRHRSRSARRSSTGSIYPKVAYLYDPPPDDEPEKHYVDATMMSGGIYTRTSGINRGTIRASAHGKQDQSRAFDAFSTDTAIAGGYPIARSRFEASIHHGWEHAPAHLTNTCSATTTENEYLSMGSRTQHPGWHSSAPKYGATTKSASAAQCSILSDIASVACSTREDSGGATHTRVSILRSSCSSLRT